MGLCMITRTSLVPAVCGVPGPDRDCLLVCVQGIHSHVRIEEAGPREEALGRRQQQSWQHVLGQKRRRRTAILRQGRSSAGA
jgi:hypothetical protein